VYGFAMAIALKYSRDNTDAKDILSHSFVKVFKSITSFDAAKGSFHAWLKKIIFNEAIDHIKQRSRFSNVEFEKAEEPHIESTVFVMYVVNGYPHKEIAEKLKISEGTSKWHLSEARKLLQQKLINLKN
jgi:DNA-directed RNA polymerase specialized sigma24 family protein